MTSCLLTGQIFVDSSVHSTWEVLPLSPEELRVSHSLSLLCCSRGMGAGLGVGYG